MSRRKLMVVTFILWLITAVIGFWQINLVRELMPRFLAYYTPVGLSDYDAFRQEQFTTGFSVYWVMAITVVWIGAILGSAEYYRTHLGHSSTWRLFAGILGVEIAIFALAFII